MEKAHNDKKEEDEVFEYTMNILEMNKFLLILKEIFSLKKNLQDL